MDKAQLVKISIILSLVSAVLAGWGFLVGDFWLASTQWLLMASVLGVWSVWMKMK